MALSTIVYPEYLTNNCAKSQKDRVLTGQFGNGFKQVVNDGLNAKIEVWTLEYRPLFGTELTEVRAFYETVGASTVFYWTPFGETVPKKWRRVVDTYKESMFNIDLIIISLTVEQDFTLEV